MVMVSPTAALLPVDAESFADERPFILEFEDLTELAFFTGVGGTAAVSAGALRFRSSTMIGYLISNRDGVESKGKTDGLSQERRRKGRKVNKIYGTTSCGWTRLGRVPAGIIIIIIMGILWSNPLQSPASSSG